MTLYQVDDDGLLFISPVIEDWAIADQHKINVVIDLEGGLDQCIPTMPGSCLYVYFPIFDEELPDAARLDAVAMLGAHLVRTGHRVLSHCGMGFNRSALIAGRILHHLGMSGPDVVSGCASAGPARCSTTPSRSTWCRCRQATCRSRSCSRTPASARPTRSHTWPSASAHVARGTLHMALRTWLRMSYCFVIVNDSPLNPEPKTPPVIRRPLESIRPRNVKSLNTASLKRI